MYAKNKLYHISEVIMNISYFTPTQPQILASSVFSRIR